jgi:hypothetical protein
MKNRVMMLATLMLLVSIGVPRHASAVSPSPVPGEFEEEEMEGVKVKGESVCLFQSGTADVRKAIKVNDILPVYREQMSHEPREVGKVRVLIYVSEDYLKGQVVEGEIRAGDIARKGDAASVVISADSTCR